MATEENTYFLRSFLLLVEGGLYILREILGREIQTAGGNLDALLKQSENRLKHEFHGKQYDKLFPQYGTTDINRWDLQLSVGVLIRVFRHSLSETENQSIRALRDLRNEIYMHCATASLDKSEYEDVQKELKYNITHLAETFDEPVRDRCSKYITQFASGPLDGVKPSLTTLNGLSLPCQKAFKVGLHPELAVGGPSEKWINLCEHTLDTILNNATAASEGAEFEEIEKNVKKMLEFLQDNTDVVFKGSKRGCIILMFECNSFDDVLLLLHRLDSQEFRDQLSRISVALLRHYQFDATISISTRVRTEHLQSILIAILKMSHSEEVTHRHLEVSSENKIDDKDDHAKPMQGSEEEVSQKAESKQPLKLDLECTSKDGLLRILNSFQKEDLSGHLKSVADALSNHFRKKITLKASLDIENFLETIEEAVSSDITQCKALPYVPRRTDVPKPCSFSVSTDSTQCIALQDDTEATDLNEDVSEFESYLAVSDRPAIEFSSTFQTQHMKMDMCQIESNLSEERLSKFQRLPMEIEEDVSEGPAKERPSKFKKTEHSGEPMHRKKEVVSETVAKGRPRQFQKAESEEPMREKKEVVSETVAKGRPRQFQKAESEEAMREKKEDLRKDLIGLYREKYHTLPLSPLLEENDTPLLEFYVMPDIESVEIQRARGGGKEIRSKVTSLHDVFYKEKEPCRNIYLTADAGFGKTALSKRLVLTWCHAKDCIPNEDEHFKKEDISTMSNFDFVFLLSLRDCSEEWDIDEMIKKQIINDLAHTISTSDFENILNKERCLIILDGLDEFTHAKSDIPHRKARRTCTILTTTRPWKLGVSKIRSCAIERKLELIGLSKTSAKSLKRSVISLLCGKTDIEKHIQDFDRAISDSSILDLETIPLSLMYLLCLWCDGIELGASRTELYCQTVELLLKRTFEKYPDMQQSREQCQSDIPQCFSEHEHCKEHYTFLQDLGQLAFETLFSENKESTLVFSRSMTEKHLTSEYLKLSLDSGMLTQSTEKTLTKQISKFSFSHKTVHELFCALYISCQNESDVKNIVLNKCKSLQSILDMSTVLIFISRMVNAEIISSISQEFLSVISEDKTTSEYRSTTDDIPFVKHPLKDIQDMYISCMKENTSDKELKLFCQDFFFHRDCKEEKYFTYLARLAVHNKNNMASININTEYSGRRLREIIDSCELHELFQINKIHYSGKVENAQLPVLLDKSPKCVTVWSSVGSRGSWSREMLETLQNNSLLQAIHIRDFKMSHDVLNEFLNYIINRKTMTEIILWRLSCTEHEHSCTFSLDFSQHSDLRKLKLGTIPKVSQLKVNSQVKHVELGGVNLGERSLPPEMANIESVYLDSVNMSASTLRDLVKVVEKLSHKVTVTIHPGCEIEPETEFEHVKQYIHSSQNFRVTEDDSLRFVFETKVES